MIETTEGGLLGGGLRFLQPAKGYRTAIDPILLAASVRLRDGEVAVDAGCGTGAASICLASRHPSCRIIGIERDPEMAEIAARNARLNGLTNLSIETDDLEAAADRRRDLFDQAVANPPYYEAGRHTPSPRAGKASAHGETDLDLEGWVEAMSRLLKPSGRLTIVHRADALQRLLAALGGRFGAMVVFPLWSKPGADAVRLIVTAIKGRRTPLAIRAGLVLHEPDGRFTPAADAILRGLDLLELDSPRDIRSKGP